MELLEIRSAKITKKGQIAIPKSVRKIEGFSEGSKVAILAFRDRVELKPMKQITKMALTALASEKVLAKDWDTKEEDAAWKSL